MKQAADYKDQLVLIAVHNSRKRLDALTALGYLSRLGIAVLHNNHFEMLFDASEEWNLPEQVAYVSLLYYSGLKEEASIQIEFAEAKFPDPCWDRLRRLWTLPNLDRPLDVLRHSWGRASDHSV